MSAPDQARLQERMTAWTKLTPQERGKVRMQFLEAKKVPATNRQADWEAYQALSPDERSALAARAASAPRAASKSAEPAAHAAPAKHSAQPRGGSAAHPAAPAQAVKAITPATPAMPATPGIVQGGPGATTVLITKRQALPAQQAAPGARVVASPDVVDKTTLLPRAGAQGTRAPSAAASTPAALR